MDKKQLRKSLKEKRKDIPLSKKVIMDKVISDTIINSECFKNARQVLVFASTDDEFDTRYIIERCRMLCKRVFYPVCLDKMGKMEFLKVDSANDLQFGTYNLLEPKQTLQKYIPKEKDLIIVPCLAADESKNRIGYGKGNCDRFLKDFNGVSICPCYSELLTDSLPTDKYDVKIDIIVTDKEVIR